MSNGKGDTPRPLSVPRDEFDSAWARTFGVKIVTDPRVPRDEIEVRDVEGHLLGKIVGLDGDGAGGI